MKYEGSFLFPESLRCSRGRRGRRKRGGDAGGRGEGEVIHELSTAAPPHTSCWVPRERLTMPILTEPCRLHFQARLRHSDQYDLRGQPRRTPVTKPFLVTAGGAAGARIARPTSLRTQPSTDYAGSAQGRGATSGCCPRYILCWLCMVWQQSTEGGRLGGFASYSLSCVGRG